MSWQIGGFPLDSGSGGARWTAELSARSRGGSPMGRRRGDTYRRGISGFPEVSGGEGSSFLRAMEKGSPLVAPPFGWGRGGTARHRGVPGLGFGASQTLPRPSSLTSCPQAHPTSRRGDLRRSLSFLHAIRPHLRPVWSPSPPHAPPFHRVLQRRA